MSVNPTPQLRDSRERRDRFFAIVRVAAVRSEAPSAWLERAGWWTSWWISWALLASMAVGDSQSALAGSLEARTVAATLNVRPSLSCVVDSAHFCALVARRQKPEGRSRPAHRRMAFSATGLVPASSFPPASLHEVCPLADAHGLRRWRHRASG